MIAPFVTPVKQLIAGEVGVLVANVKELTDARIGNSKGPFRTANFADRALL